MKTYETTPRDQLLKLGKLGIGRHLDKCETDLEGLGEQKDYAVAEMEVSVKKAKKEMDRGKTRLANVKNVTSKSRAETRAEKKKILKEVTTLEKNLVTLNGEYNKQFTAWFKLKEKMTAKMAKVKKCKCNPKSFLLQRKRSLRVEDASSGQLTPEEKYMYDMAKKVEQCEGKVIIIKKEIAAAEQAGRKAQFAALADREKFGKSMADQQRLDKIMNQKPHVAKLKVTKFHLERSEKDRKRQVESYKKTNAEIEQNLKKLDVELKNCGCKV